MEVLEPGALDSGRHFGCRISLRRLHSIGLHRPKASIYDLEIIKSQLGAQAHAEAGGIPAVGRVGLTMSGVEVSSHPDAPTMPLPSHRLQRPQSKGPTSRAAVRASPPLFQDRHRPPRSVDPGPIFAIGDSEIARSPLCASRSGLGSHGRTSSQSRHRSVLASAARPFLRYDCPAIARGSE